MSRPITFKTSVAALLLGLELPTKKLQDLVGREKPVGQHHMRYTPEDIRVARYRRAGVEPSSISELPLGPVKLPPIIVTRMTKGGVGKTSLSVNIAASMAMSGYRILFVDADPQATASNLLGVETSSYDSNIVHIGEFLKRSSTTPDLDLPSAIVHVYQGGFLDLIPADITLAEVDASLVTAMSSHTRAELFLNRNSAFLAQNYDAIIVDTAPGTTPIGLAFTYASKDVGKVLTVVEPEGSCLRALDSLASNLEEIYAVTKALIGIEVVINKYHPSLKHVRESMGFLYSKYGAHLNDVVVPQFSGFARQLDAGSKDASPVVEIEPSSSGAAAIFDLTKSLIRSFGITQPGLPQVER